MGAVMGSDGLWGRRRFLVTAATTTSAALIGLSGGSSASALPGPDITEAAPPTEDLMRDHGILERVLLVYGEVSRRIQAGEELPAAPVYQTALLVRQFVEDYHEHLEEQYVFPRLRAAGLLSQTITILHAQHQMGRAVTDLILLRTNVLNLSLEDRQVVLTAVTDFSRMYAPHEAREDTVVFPALRAIAPAAEFAELGERFHNEEISKFGVNGFNAIVSRVAEIEQILGIYNLGQFTPGTR
jgi:hemerythrin-like domain-containing protein